MHFNNQLTHKFLFKIYIVFFIIGKINGSFIRINDSPETQTIETSLGDCTVSVCGDGYCASPNNGTCVEVEESSECRCKKGFTDIEDMTTWGCCYKQKSGYTALFLEMLIGFGAGHFYVGNIMLGFFKLGIYVVLFALAAIVCIKRMKMSIKSRDSFWMGFAKTAIIMGCGCVYVGWQMLDSAIFSLGGYKDGNNMPLY